MNSCHSLIVVVIAVMVTTTLAGYADSQNPDYYTVPKYAYKYGVADKVTDGVVRTVEYIVDPIGGFRANVINSGQGVHPYRG
ncbi:unnamed protein product [Orchesella dallaii]|uniref:Uncharacterized protein n=1 Tax=Orchesella dallaii TaxID=48710 RepID=A0ABP1R3M9_9HEXA